MDKNESRKRKLSFFSIFFTFILDNLGWAFVIPLLGPLILNKDLFPFLIPLSIGKKTIILGFLLGAFPLAQFIGAPILGDLGDTKGRKKAFIFSILLSTIGYVLSAYSIYIKSLSFLFLGRIISGLFSGNLSLCLASIADLSTSAKNKTKNFGYLSIFAGISLIIGAYLGGKLSDKAISSIFDPAFPFEIAAILGILNLFFISFGFFETKKRHKKYHFQFFQSFSNIFNALKNKKINKMYMIFFFFIFSWSMLFHFFPILLIKKFNFGFSKSGDIVAVIGISWAIGSGLISKIFSRIISNIKLLEITLLLLILPLSLLGFIHRIEIIISIIIFCSILGGISWPACNAIISEKTKEEVQGKILGITQSMQSFAICLSPMIGGYLANISIVFPFLLAAISSIVGVTIYIKEVK